jgi:hypothetical protein
MEFVCTLVQIGPFKAPVTNEKHVPCAILFVAYGPGNLPCARGPDGLQSGHNANIYISYGHHGGLGRIQHEVLD